METGKTLYNKKKIRWRKSGRKWGLFRIIRPAMATLPFFFPSSLTNPPFPVCLIPSSQSAPHLICQAQKKGKKKRMSRPFGGESNNNKDVFEDLMVVWDYIFEICCDNPERALALKELAWNGLELHGRGCVLVQEVAKSLPRGRGSGFLFKSAKPLSKKQDEKPEDPQYCDSVSWKAEYVPREFLVDPMLAPEDVFSSIETQEVTIPIVSRENLYSVLRGADRTRLLSLTANTLPAEYGSLNSKSMQLIDMKTQDAGGEEAYDPRKAELVLMLAVSFDGKPVVGADVLQAYLDHQNDTWKLKLRSYETVPL